MPWEPFGGVEFTPLSPLADHCCCGQRVQDFLLTLAGDAVEIPTVMELIMDSIK